MNKRTPLSGGGDKQNLDGFCLKRNVTQNPYLKGCKEKFLYLSFSMIFLQT
jgi:hypothetical protein